MGLLSEFQAREPEPELEKEVLTPIPDLELIKPGVEIVPPPALTVSDLVIKRGTRGLIDTIETVKNGERIKLNFKRDNAGRLTKISGCD
jgi:hypothetical protein